MKRESAKPLIPSEVGTSASYRHIPGFPERSDTRSADRIEPNLSIERTKLSHAVLSATNLAIGWGKGNKLHLLSEGISLVVQAGILTVLVGPNGSGKSSLLRTLAGLQPFPKGDVMLDGRPLHEFSAEERSRKIACVFNERMETGYFSVFDIVAFGRYPYTDTRNRLSSEDLDHIRQALDVVGMTSFQHQVFSSLSDGEKQKVLIARVIAQNTPILILDEPTAFLDAPSRMDIFTVATRLAHTAGKAVILCTHEIELALHYADMLWIMDREHRFTTGAPSLVAFSGAINRAFATATTRFDPLSGTFKSIEKHDFGHGRHQDST